MDGVDGNGENDRYEEDGDKVKNIIYKNICIGIDSFDSFHLMGNGMIGDMVGNERKRYCREIKSNDIVTMEIDCDKGISFGINNNW